MHETRMLLVSVALFAVAGCAASPHTPKGLSRLAGWHGEAPNGAGTFHFIVVSDRTGGHEEGAWAKAIADIDRLKPDFVMCVGDLVEGYNDDEAVMQQEWDEFEAITRQLDAPFFYCAGNHDVTDPVPRKVYTKRHGVGGRTYYSFNYRRCHFVVLDSEAIVDSRKAIADAQWQWLTRDLTGARDAEHVFLFYHHPIHDRPGWARLRAMLDPAKTTIFNGHWHELSYDIEDGVPYFILSSTSAKTGNDRKTGQFSSFANVVVDHGQPTVSIIPVGEVLPYNFIDRHLQDIVEAMTAGAELSPVTKDGTKTRLRLVGPTEGTATVTLAWTAKDGWFAGGVPAPETLTLTAGAVVSRDYRLSATKPQTQDPVVAVTYKLELTGKTAQGTAKMRLPVIATLDVHRVSGISIDGDLADWSSVPGVTTNTRSRVTYHPDAWSGPADAAMTTRLGYDERNLYLAFEVSDDAIVTKGRNDWDRDGLEIFWDPRSEKQRSGLFEGPCRQIIIAAPGASGPSKMAIYPADSIPQSSINTVCVRRPGGYVVEIAIPFSAVGRGFQPSPGANLYFEAILDDKDPGGDRGVLSELVLSGDDNASRRTVGYGRLTFQP